MHRPWPFNACTEQNAALSAPHAAKTRESSISYYETSGESEHSFYTHGTARTKSAPGRRASPSLRGIDMVSSPIPGACLRPATSDNISFSGVPPKVSRAWHLTPTVIGGYCLGSEINNQPTNVLPLSPLVVTPDPSKAPEARLGHCTPRPF